MTTRDRSKGKLELFVQRDGQLRLLDKSTEESVAEEQQVECLGHILANRTGSFFPIMNTELENA